MKRLIECSVACYRLLLFVYPGEHRRTYGPLMADAFDDLCRVIAKQYGAAGLLTLWLETLVDVMTSSAEEHLDKEIDMARFIRWSGGFAIVGGLLWIVLIGLLSRETAERLADPFSRLNHLIPLFTMSTVAIVVGVLGLDGHNGSTRLLTTDVRATAGFGKPGVKTLVIAAPMLFLGLLMLAAVPGPEGSKLISFGWPFMWLLIPVVGTFVVGLYSVKASHLPRWSSLLLIAGTLLLPFFNALNARVWLALPFGIAWIAAGFLISRQEPRHLAPTAIP